MTIRLLKAEPLKHGGNLIEAKQRYSVPDERWLDMSTGISPWAWPVPAIDDSLWRDLPAPLTSLRKRAATHFATQQEHIAITPGSQLAIRLIPQLYKASKVAIPSIGYQEHAYSWKLAGHAVVTYEDSNHLLNLVNTQTIEHAVIINPNNPTGEITSEQNLSEIANGLKGELFVDEAFACGLKHNDSVLRIASNIVVFKSIGKFYGLAGVRIGFVLANKDLVDSLNTLLEPWSISGPSLEIADTALADTEWQAAQRHRIMEQEKLFIPLLQGLKEQFSISSMIHSGLFHTLFGDRKKIDELHHNLAEIGVWTRRYNEDDLRYWLRFSLPLCVDQLCQRISKIKGPSS